MLMVTLEVIKHLTCKDINAHCKKFFNNRSFYVVFVKKCKRDQTTESNISKGKCSIKEN